LFSHRRREERDVGEKKNHRSNGGDQSTKEETGKNEDPRLSGGVNFTKNEKKKMSILERNHKKPQSGIRQYQKTTKPDK